MTIHELFDIFINDSLIDIILSSPKSKTSPSKVSIRPVMLHDKLYFQCSTFDNNQVFHKNMGCDAVKEHLLTLITDCYKQTQFTNSEKCASVLSGKKGNLTIKLRQNNNPKKMQAPLSHNRTKQYILREGVSVPFLVDLGIMTADGKIVNAKYDKYRQINRFLEFIEDILPKLDKKRKQTIIDFGCGKSYLTFAMYYYLKILKGYDINIIGLDLKKDVINNCQALAEKYGYKDLRFLVGDIASYNDTDHVNMVVTLHACDTATDYALSKAVSWGADVILSVPCCQHEANKQIANSDLEPILKYGILKERISALITDGIRANLLEKAGYKTQILEFIDIEHTPKNLLIRAVKDENADTSGDVQKLCDLLNLDLTLSRLM